MKYANKTTVKPEKSRGEIEAILKRYGACEFMYGWKESAGQIGFKFQTRLIRFVVPMPDMKDDSIRLDGRGYIRSDSAQQTAYNQSERQRWRALLLVIKAKLEAVETGITTFEEEFFAHFVLPGGKTVFQKIMPAIEQLYRGNDVPLLDYIK